MASLNKVLIESMVFTCLILIVIIADGEAAEPTLARLSFLVPPERMSEFEAVYKKDVAPILKAQGLAASSRQGRTTPDSVFSRLFELKTPSEVHEKWEQSYDPGRSQEWLRTKHSPQVIKMGTHCLAWSAGSPTKLENTTGC